jgi:hypothetical protein
MLLFFLMVIYRATLIQSAELNDFANLRRRLVTGGTPTGGNKYPFLTVIRWQYDADLLVRYSLYPSLTAPGIVLARLLIRRRCFAFRLHLIVMASWLQEMLSLRSGSAYRTVRCEDENCSRHHSIRRLPYATLPSSEERDGTCCSWGLCGTRQRVDPIEKNDERSDRRSEANASSLLGRACYTSRILSGPDQCPIKHSSISSDPRCCRVRLQPSLERVHRSQKVSSTGL